MSKSYTAMQQYTYRNIYPNFAGSTLTEDTSPEASDQQVMTVTEPIVNDTPKVNEKTQNNIWLIIGLALLLIVFFGVGGR